MRSFLWSLAAALLLASLACDEDPAGPPDAPPPGLVGTVLDADSLPVAGASVGVIYGLPPLTEIPDWPPADWPSEETCGLPGGIGYYFSIEAPSRVTLRILDHRDRCVSTLAEDLELAAGWHMIHWSRRNDAGLLVAAGAYRAHLEIRRTGFSDIQENQPLLLNTLSIDYEDCIGPAVVTDTEGRFRIAYADLPLGTEVHYGFDETRVIPDTLWIQTAAAAGRARQILRIVNLESDQEVTLVLSAAP